MGVLSSIWESIEDAGSTLTKGLEDSWDTIDQVYIDDFLGGLSEGVASFSEKAYDIVRTEEYQGALASAMAYQGFQGPTGAEGGGSPDWIKYLQKGSELLGGGQGSGDTTPSGMRSTNYSSLIGRLNNIITQQIDPYEEILIPTGARY